MCRYYLYCNISDITSAFWNRGIECFHISDKFDANVVAHFSPTEKGGETYWLLKNLDFDFKVSKLYMNLANLFNGDKALGECDKLTNARK